MQQDVVHQSLRIRREDDIKALRGSPNAFDLVEPEALLPQSEETKHGAQ